MQAKDEEVFLKKSGPLKISHKSKKTGKKKKNLFLPISGFNAALYRNLTSSNKIYIWAFEIFVLTSLSLFFIIILGFKISYLFYYKHFFLL
jgi:hypothetical protein